MAMSVKDKVKRDLKRIVGRGGSTVPNGGPPRVDPVESIKRIMLRIEQHAIKTLNRLDKIEEQLALLLPREVVTEAAEEVPERDATADEANEES